MENDVRFDELRLVIGDPVNLSDSLDSTKLLSPLRYPGGKRRLAPLIAEILRSSGKFPQLSVEPFTGGASVSLHLLINNLVDRIGLCDKDELVTSFWQTVFFDSSWFIEAIESLEVSIKTWDEFRLSKPVARRQQALKCLFLNRTSFSGILANGAGPIGGRAQTSDYKIGCRFPKAALITRIRSLSSYSDRVAFIENCSWEDSLSLSEDAVRFAAVSDIFVYLDPPFFQKADKLYRHFFIDENHVALRDRLVNTDIPWLLSYDSPERVRDLYSGNHQHELNVLYSAASSSPNFVKGEILVSNLEFPGA